MADADALKSLNGLLNGIAQKVYYNKSEITEDLLKNELYPELSQEEFHTLHEKMKGLVKVIWQAIELPGGFEMFSHVKTFKVMHCVHRQPGLFNGVFVCGMGG